MHADRRRHTARHAPSPPPSPTQPFQLGRDPSHQAPFGAVKDEDGGHCGDPQGGEKRQRFLIETVGEAVAEVILSLLACALLGCMVLIAT
ncbi:hypothetical protein [Streptomyces wuyuanensis]|uniref:hypothetical protein n=1 Tax=Streptomyces wuyuanensis TaxID=1196353 RepID=UPI0037139B94